MRYPYSGMCLTVLIINDFIKKKRESVCVFPQIIYKEEYGKLKMLGVV